MAFIYCIENTINQKRYVGETTYSIDKRWKEHIRMSRRDFKHRPLYAAINKYGVENFIIYLLEECSDEVRWDKEQYWIKKLNSYNDGYNATIGGDGGSTKEIDKEVFISLYEQHFSPQELAEYFNCCTDTISAYAKNLELVLKVETKEMKSYALKKGFIKVFIVHVMHLDD